MKTVLGALMLLPVFMSACQSAPRPLPARPYVLVLGTAQDAGLPQIACTCSNCVAARQDPGRARFTSSLLLVDPRTGKRWLFDATPDLPQQVELARAHGGPGHDASGRPALFDGVFLTHAHMGHYTGLMHLGREAYGGQALPVHLSARFASFLASNGPWDLLVSESHIDLQPFELGLPVRLAPDLAVTALAVPHRDEYSDTVAFLIEGPSHSLLYLPDIDKWELWERSIEDLIGEVDVALLDGTFYSGAELPGRSMAEIPHPFIEESLARFARLSTELRKRVIFTHLNHSNPVTDPDGAAARAVAAAGLGVAYRGQVFDL